MTDMLSQGYIFVVNRSKSQKKWSSGNRKNSSFDTNIQHTAARANDTIGSMLLRANLSIWFKFTEVYLQGFIRK